MISKEVFLKLKRGDIVLYGKNKIPRVIELGPADYDPPISAVHLSILKRSWTGRIHTTYTCSDRSLFTLPRKKLRTSRIRPVLIQRLRDMGFNVGKELKREILDLKKTNQWWEEWGYHKFKGSKCLPTGEK